MSRPIFVFFAGVAAVASAAFAMALNLGLVGVHAHDPVGNFRVGASEDITVLTVSGLTDSGLPSRSKPTASGGTAADTAAVAVPVANGASGAVGNPVVTSSSTGSTAPKPESTAPVVTVRAVPQPGNSDDQPSDGGDLAEPNVATTQAAAETSSLQRSSQTTAVAAEQSSNEVDDIDEPETEDEHLVEVESGIEDD